MEIAAVLFGQPIVLFQDGFLNGNDLVPGRGFPAGGLRVVARSLRRMRVVRVVAVLTVGVARPPARNAGRAGES